MTETKPKRRWFRFSLRMLFVVVTIAGIGIGGFPFFKEARLVYQRRQFLHDLEWNSRKFPTELFHARAELSPSKNADQSLSPIRRFFNDHFYWHIALPSNYNQDSINEAVELFPEANIHHWTPFKPVLVQLAK